VNADKKWMTAALTQAERAYQLGEVPVGAIMVDGAGEWLGEGHNRTIVDCDPSGHAEIIAIRQAAINTGNHRLSGATLYVTLEPCLMCAGALLQARVDRIVYAARDPKRGVCGTLINLVDSPFMNHRCAVEAGVMADESALILAKFFSEKR
jgi:tRNA(adenine34) deaminase